jgi:ABC-type multidrug transport system ATPase subunit
VENIISMCLDVTDFSKDNMNVRKNLVVLCDRPSLEVKKTAKENLTRPQASYLMSTERKEILNWLKKLKFPDRYVANIK